MELLRIKKNLRVKTKHRSGAWKWATAFYIAAWPFAIAQMIIFFFSVSDDQLCQVNIKNGFATWRSVSVLNSVFLSPLVLLAEFFFNQIVFKARHILIPLALFLLYLFVSTFISFLLAYEPPYVRSFNFFDHQSTINWLDLRLATQHDMSLLGRVQYCHDYYMSISPLYEEPSQSVPADIQTTLITIGIMATSLIFGYLITSASTQFSKLSDEELVKRAYSTEEH